MLAEQTGWTEDFLFWSLPLKRVWAYVLCYCRANGVKCQWARSTKGTLRTETDLRDLVRLLQ